MSEAEQPENAPASAKRADVVRNQKKLLAAAAEVFVASGVDAPVREIAARAGVGMGTLYRHFPTRADLVVAVFRHRSKSANGPAPACCPEPTRRWQRCASGSTCSSTSWSPSTVWPTLRSRT